MENLIWLQIFLMGVLGNLIVRRSGDIGQWILNKRGETATGTEGTKTEGKEAVKFSTEQQDFVNNLLANQKRSVEQKFGNYEELAKFKQEHDQKEEQNKQKQLEEAKKYDELKKGWEGKEGEYKGIISKKDLEIQGMRINHALSNEINKQNGYVEESLNLLRDNVVIDANGNALFKSKDANGIESQIPIAEGVKKFLEQRPYLVRSTHKPGSGAASNAGAEGQGGAAGGADDLNSLNQQLYEAANRGDRKSVNEIKTKIQVALAKKNITRNK